MHGHWARMATCTRRSAHLSRAVHVLQGYNAQGQVGDGSTTTRQIPVQVTGAWSWVQVELGNAHVCGLTTARQILCWVR